MNIEQKKEQYEIDKKFISNPWTLWRIAYPHTSEGVVPEDDEHLSRLIGLCFRDADGPDWKTKEIMVRRFGETCFNEVAAVIGEEKAVDRDKATKIINAALGNRVMFYSRVKPL
jgi:hypothetical protein